MIYLLDTNTVSEVKKPKPHAGCLAWLNARSDDCAISAVTVAELRWGIEGLREGKQNAMMERDFAFFMEDFEGRFFDFDCNAAREWGRYAAELETGFGHDWWKTYDFRDTQIAAIAREYGMTVVTRNTKHFPFCQTVNPFLEE